MAMDDTNANRLDMLSNRLYDFETAFRLLGLTEPAAKLSRERKLLGDIAADLRRPVDPADQITIAAYQKLAGYTVHSPDCDKDPQRAVHPDENACTCGLNALLGLEPEEN